MGGISCWILPVKANRDVLAAKQSLSKFVTTERDPSPYRGMGSECMLSIVGRSKGVFVGSTVGVLVM